MESVFDAQGCTRWEVAEGDVGTIADFGSLRSEKNTLLGHRSICSSPGLRNWPNRPVNIAVGSQSSPELWNPEVTSAVLQGTEGTATTGMQIRAQCPSAVVFARRRAWPMPASPDKGRKDP